MRRNVGATNTDASFFHGNVSHVENDTNILALQLLTTTTTIHYSTPLHSTLLYSTHNNYHGKLQFRWDGVKHGVGWAVSGNGSKGGREIIHRVCVSAAVCLYVLYMHAMYA